MPTWTRAETLRTAGAVTVMLLACASAVYGGRPSKTSTIRRVAGSESDFAAANSDDPLDVLRRRDPRKRWAAQEADSPSTAVPPRTNHQKTVRAPLELGNDDEGDVDAAPGLRSENGIAPPSPDELPALQPPGTKSAGSRARRTPALRDSLNHRRERSIDTTPIANPSTSETDDVAVEAAHGRRGLRPSGADSGLKNPSKFVDEVREQPRSGMVRAARTNPSQNQEPESEAAEDLAAVQPPPPAERQQETLAGSETGSRGTPTLLAARPRLVPVAQQDKSNLGPEPIRDPRNLPKIDTIQPYSDYEPDPERLKEDRCHNLCPRPKFGCPECKKGEDGKPQCPDCPEEILLSREPLAPRNFAGVKYCWEPSNLWNYPLYFEDYELERYGHTRGCIQPLWSVGRFGFQLFGLPYQMTIDPICKRRYALGYYRPGECVPPKYYQPPWNTEAAVVEAGVLTGAYFLFAP